jgi:protein-glutamine gamma-glutamyltransferase
MRLKALSQLSLFQKIKQRLKELPLPKTEESIVLRILVQVLVIIGIIATDVAGKTMTSVWAIPLSIVGAVWSWQNRKKPNITAKFLIAMGMIAIMVLFFGELFRNLNDTRLVLAKLLIQLQVLHSFDLPRRKDLGYSTVIGIILLGVAGTVSQTLAFAPLLLLFLGVVFPVLLLDYRSRLDLKPLDNIFFSGKNKKNPTTKNLKWQQYFPLSPQKFASFLGMVLLLGLLIFAVMPRFPGYQLQSFPVSGGSEMTEDQQSFDQENREISNPGYVSEGATTGQGGEGAGEGEGKSPIKGAGQVDDTFYYGFNRTMNMNLRGEMEQKLVMRVRSQSPGFWRVLGFDRYTGQGWEFSRDDQLITIPRPTWTYRFNLNNSYPKGGTKRVIQSYTVVSELPNIIPTLQEASQLYFPTKEVAVDPEGSLRSPSFMGEGLTYTVVSEVPFRDRTLLREAKPKYSKTIEEYYLQIPEEIKEKIKAKAEELMAKATYDLDSNYEKVLFLTQALKQNYQINPDLPFLEEDEDLAEAFLYRYNGGYPDHFPAVLTVMLRSIGIPARLGVGFSSGQFNPFTGYYLVHNTDAHALTEVYFGEYGWFAFDPIPGHDLFPPSVEEYTAFGVIKQFWDWVAGWLPSPVTAFFKNLWDFVVVRLLLMVVKLWEFFSGSIMGFLIGIIALIGVSFLGWLSFNQGKKWFKKRRLSKLSPEMRLYQQMISFLEEKGYGKHPSQTPLEYALKSFEYYEKEQAQIIMEITQAYVSWRYGDYPQNLVYLQGQLKMLEKSFQRLKIH